MTTTPATQIEIDERGVARIAGTRMKVAQVAHARNAWGMTPEEIQANHPRLSLSQVYGALSYYYDHKVEVDAKTDEEDALADQLAREASDPVFRAKLVAAKNSLR